MNKLKEDTFKSGSVKISNDILVQIALIAAFEVEGVQGIGNISREDISNKVTKGFQNIKGISINIVDNKVAVDLNLIIRYDYKLQEVSKNVQENVKKQIEIMTGLTVKEINVLVDSIK